MTALVWHGKRDVRYDLVRRPEIKEPTDVLVRITATSICGSDLHLYNNELPGMMSGDVLGHECMGVIQKVGPHVQNLKIGQRVVVCFDIACGGCEYCQRQEYEACDTTNKGNQQEEAMFGIAGSTAAILGYGHLVGGLAGGQAEFLRVPFGDMNCLPLPDDIPDQKALFLSDIACTSHWACVCGEVKRGDTVGIWGLGPVGLLTARWAQLFGASRVIGLDEVPERLACAKNKLGIEVVDIKTHDVLKTMKQLVPRGLDVAIDCTGFRFARTLLHRVERAVKMETDTSETITQCCSCLRKRGRLSLIADYTGHSNHFPIGVVMMKSLQIKGGQCPVQRFWKLVLDKMRKGEFDPSFIITHRMALSAGPEAYRKFDSREEGFIKVFMRPDEEASKSDSGVSPPIPGALEAARFVPTTSVM
jgi:threonine dehydrogenase-like Zn-dependent dehydrogenase